MARRKSRNPLHISYEIGVWQPAFGRILEIQGYVSGTHETPVSELKRLAAEKLGVPKRSIRLRQCLVEKPHWF
jgi:hypothetical protein